MFRCHPRLLTEVKIPKGLGRELMYWGHRDPVTGELRGELSPRDDVTVGITDRGEIKTDVGLRGRGWRKWYASRGAEFGPNRTETAAQVELIHSKRIADVSRGQGTPWDIHLHRLLSGVVQVLPTVAKYSLRFGGYGKHMSFGSVGAWLKRFDPSQDMPVVLYHGTSSVYREAIESKGLRPRADTEQGPGWGGESHPSTPDRVYITGLLTNAKEAAEKVAQAKGGWPIIYKITSLPDPARLHADEDAFGHDVSWRESLRGIGNVAYAGRIPASLIEPYLKLRPILTKWGRDVESSRWRNWKGEELPEPEPALAQTTSESMYRTPPTMLMEMDRHLRDLERKASLGDPEALARLERGRRRAGVGSIDLSAALESASRVWKEISRRLRGDPRLDNDPDLNEYIRNVDEHMYFFFRSLPLTLEPDIEEPEQDAEMYYTQVDEIHHLGGSLLSFYRLATDPDYDMTVMGDIVGPTLLRKLKKLGDEIQMFSGYERRNRERQAREVERRAIEAERAATHAYLSAPDPQETTRFRSGAREMKRRSASRKRQHRRRRR